MSYHVSRAGRRLDVFSLDAIREKLLSGELLADDLGWTPGMSDWRPLADITTAHNPPPAPASLAAEKPIATATANSDREEHELARTPASLSPNALAKHRGRPRRRSKPSNHLVLAVLVTLFCCLPLGIPAIVYGSRVDAKYQGGDYSGAHEASHRAKRWIRIAAVVGLIGILVYATLTFVGVTMAE